MTAVVVALGAGLSAGLLAWATGLVAWWVALLAATLAVLAVAARARRTRRGSARAGVGARVGALVGALLGLAANLALTAATVVQQGGLGSEWLDTVIGWDLPTTALCACIGAAIGLGRRRERSQPAPR